MIYCFYENSSIFALY